MQSGQDILLELKLMRERVNTDKTAVVMAVGYVTPVTHTRFKHNLLEAYAECCDSFRAALLHWAPHHPAALGLPPGNSMQPR